MKSVFACRVAHNQGVTPVQRIVVEDKVVERVLWIVQLTGHFLRTIVTKVDKYIYVPAAFLTIAGNFEQIPIIEVAVR
jgi:hypothetical protein